MLICSRYLSGLARTPAPELMSKKSILNKKIIRKTKPSLLPEYIERSSIPSSIHEVFIGSGVLSHGTPARFVSAGIHPQFLRPCLQSQQSVAEPCQDAASGCRTGKTASRAASSKKLGTRGIAFHVLLCLCLLRSVVATPHLNLSRDSVGLEIVGHAIRQLHRMNALTFYRELIDWLLSNVTEENMFLIQSVATCCSLGWCVCSCILCADGADTDAVTKAPLASMAHPLETRSRAHQHSRC